MADPRFLAQLHVAVPASLFSAGCVWLLQAFLGTADQKRRWWVGLLLVSVAALLAAVASVGVAAVLTNPVAWIVVATVGLLLLFGIAHVVTRRRLAQVAPPATSAPGEPPAPAPAAIGIRLIDARWNRIHDHADVSVEITTNAPEPLHLTLVDAIAQIRIPGADLSLERVSADERVTVLPLPQWTTLEFSRSGVKLPRLNVEANVTSTRCEVRLRLRDRGEFVCAGRVGLDGY